MQDIVFSPANDNQRDVIHSFHDNDIMIITGPAGSGKTHIAMYLALRSMIRYKSKILLGRPVVTTGEEIGFLPGKLEQKMRPWLLPFHDVLASMTFTSPEEIFRNVEIVPLAFMRGRTFNHCVAILDEAQNATYEQLKLFLTRIGMKAKLIITGDFNQCDRKDSGLADVCQRVKDLPGVKWVELSRTENPRHPIIPRLLSVL